MGFWNDANVARLKELSGNNWSASQIADALGTTRNAVIGKMDRLNNPNRGRSKKVSVRASTDRSQRQQRSRVGLRNGSPPASDESSAPPSHLAGASPASPPLGAKSSRRTMIVGRGPQSGEAPANTAIIAEALDPDRAPQQAKFIPLMDLDDKHCRWPLERDGKTLFCGCDPKTGSSYCATHHKRGHVRRVEVVE